MATNDVKLSNEDLQYFCSLVTDRARALGDYIATHPPIKGDGPNIVLEETIKEYKKAALLLVRLQA